MVSTSYGKKADILIEADKMSYQLRLCTSLLEDQHSIPTSHVVLFIDTSDSWGSDILILIC